VRALVIFAVAAVAAAQVESTRPAPGIVPRPATIAGIPTDVPGAYSTSWTHVKSVYRVRPASTAVKVKR